MRGNPKIGVCAARLRARNTPDTVIVIACIHTLLTILTAMVRADPTWDAHHAAA